MNVAGCPADSYGHDEAGEIRVWGPSRQSPEPTHPAAPPTVHGIVQSLHREIE